MAQEEIKGEVYKAIASLTYDSFDDKTEVSEVLDDALDVLSMVVKLEQALFIRLDGGEVNKFSFMTVGQVVNYLADICDENIA